MSEPRTKRKRLASIIFLFYSNLLMGEFTRSNGVGKTLAAAIADIFTPVNFAIALTSALIGYVVVARLRADGGLSRARRLSEAV